MPKSFIRTANGRRLHHPENLTASSMARGRHLEPQAVAAAQHWRKSRLRQLSVKPILKLSYKERHLLKELQAAAGRG